MLRPLTALLLLLVLATGLIPMPHGGQAPCSPALRPVATALQQPASPMPGSCHDAMSPAQCPAGLCLTVAGQEALLSTPSAAAVPEWTAVPSSHTPLPPVPPPPQA